MLFSVRRPAERTQQNELSSASDEQTGERTTEAAIGAEPCESGGRQFVAPAGAVAPAAKQPILLAAMEDVMEDHLTGGPSSQNPDLPRAASRAQHPAADGVEDTELDMP